MIGALDTVLEALRAHEAELRRFGVSHASVFGSVARGEARADSDVDVLVELDQDHAMGIFEYARLKLYVQTEARSRRIRKLVLAWLSPKRRVFTRRIIAMVEQIQERDCTRNQRIALG